VRVRTVPENVSCENMLMGFSGKGEHKIGQNQRKSTKIGENLCLRTRHIGVDK
jgi:hypothetical protein